MAYFVRVTASYDEIKPFCESVPCDTLVVYEHDASQVHCHFYIITSLKTDSLKVRLKKLRNFDKTQWSFKTARDDRCVRYMAKGKYDPKYVKGFSQDIIDAYKADWKEEPTKKEKPSVYDLAQEVYSYVKEEVCDTDEKYYQLLIFNAINVHHKYRKAFCDFSLMKVVETAATFSIQGTQNLERRMLSKIFRY